MEIYSKRVIWESRLCAGNVYIILGLAKPLYYEALFDRLLTSTSCSCFFMPCSSLIFCQRSSANKQMTSWVSARVSHSSHG